MKFVHLTPHTLVGRILRTGIRLGDGQRGPGVYAVPLFRITRRSFKADPCAPNPAVDFSVPITSATLWRDRLRSWQLGGHRLRAVVFEPPASCWPARLFLCVAPEVASPLLASLRAGSSATLPAVTPAAAAFVAAAARQGHSADLAATAQSPAALGNLLRLFVAHGGSTWSRNDDTLEVVFPVRIPPSAIRRLVPLSQTNAKARARKHALPWPGSDDT